MSSLFDVGATSEDGALERVALHLEHPKRVDILVAAIRQALDEVIATGRTGRWNLDQCNDQEKAYVGVNLENVLRLRLGLPPHQPRRPDFVIEGVEVDCKWSRNWGGWQIPMEAVGHVCLLVYGDDLEDELAIGLVRIREEMLVGGNRDKKRTIKRPAGLEMVRWIKPRGAGLPPNFLMNLRKADRDAILEPRGGDERAKQLFKRCDGQIITRRMIEAIGQQVDDARRFRGETREALRAEGFEALNGHWKDQKERARLLGGPVPQGSEEWVCLRSDGSSYSRRQSDEPLRRAEARIFRQELKAQLSTERFRRNVAPVEELLLERIEKDASDRVDAARDAVKWSEDIAREMAQQLSLDGAPTEVGRSWIN
jgi:hypothetical protein